MATDGTAPDGRDPRTGKFARGNRAARGNRSAIRQHELSEAVRAAITPADLQAVLRQMQAQAVKGDTAAAALLLSHAIGRPREQRPVVDVDLPDLRTATGTAAALALIAREAAAGRLDLDAARGLAGIVAAAADGIALAGIEQRLAALEAARAPH